MAKPEMFANTPSPGHISWGEFNIAYEGVGYNFSPGSTDKRWVWWRFGVGLEMGDVLPENLTDDDVVLFGNKEGVPVRIQSSTLIDGELLVNGSVLADALSADAVTTEHLMAGDALVEGIARIKDVIASTVQTTGLKIGNSTWSEEAGFVIPGVVKFPVTGEGVAEILAAMTAESLSVKDYLSIRGKINSIEAGSRILINDGVTAPRTAPSVTSWWYSFKPLTPWYTNAKFAGLNVVNSATPEVVTSQSTGLGGYLQRYTNGVLTQEISLGGLIVDAIEWVADGGSLSLGASGDPGSYFVLGHDWYTGDYKILKVNSSLSAITGTYALGPKSMFVKTPTMGFYSDTHMQIIGWTSATTLQRDFRTWANPAAASAGVSQFVNEGSAFDLAGHTQWAPDLGGANYNNKTVWGRTVNPMVYVSSNMTKFSYPTGTPAFVRPYGRELCGVDGGWVLDTSGFIYQILGTIQTSGSEVAYSFADVDTVGGQHETALSPIAKLNTVSPGAGWRIGVAPPPDDGTTDSPNTSPVYARTNASSSFRYQGYPDLVTLTFDFNTINTTSTAHGGLPGFESLGLAPAYLASAASDTAGEIVRINGDGSGRMGPYRWDKNGAATTRVDDSGWLDLPLANGWTNYGAGWNGAQYRKIGNRVVLRGLIRAGTIGVNVAMANLPVGFRPVTNQLLSASHSQINEATSATTRTTSTANTHNHTVGVGGVTLPLNNPAMRIDVYADGQVLQLNSALAAGGWVSLFGLEFYTD